RGRRGAPAPGPPRPEPGPEPLHSLNAAALPRLRAACALVALSLSACGKRGDPLAPLPRTPQPVSGLAVAQRGQNLEVTYVAPRATTGGVALEGLEVEVLRAETEGDFAKVARAGSR